MLQPRHLPNLISLMRILLVVPVVWLLMERQFGGALVLFFVAGVSDGLDGFLAKRYGWQSRVGGVLDALADKILLTSSLICLALLAVLPWWLVQVIVLRDVVIFGGGLLYNYRIAEFHAHPNMVSKLSTFLQIVLVLLLVYNLWADTMSQQWLVWLVWAVALTTVLSALLYVVEWSRKAHQNN